MREVKTEFIGVRVTRELKQRLRAKCKDANLSECVRRILSEYLRSR